MPWWPGRPAHGSILEEGRHGRDARATDMQRRTWHFGLLGVALLATAPLRQAPAADARHTTVSVVEADGSLRADYLARLARVLDRADELGMVPILGVFYFGQGRRLADEQACVRAVDGTVDWLAGRGYANVVVEIANECNNEGYA